MFQVCIQICENKNKLTCFAQNVKKVYIQALYITITIHFNIVFKIQLNKTNMNLTKHFMSHYLKLLEKEKFEIVEIKINS